MSHPANPPRGGLRIAIGTGLLVCSGLLFVRVAGPWPGDAIVWPAAVAVLGALLIWRAPAVVPGRRRTWAAHRPSEPSPPREPSVRVRALGRPEVSRGGLGVALVLAGGFAFLWASGATRPAGETVLAGLAVLIAVALIFAPSWRRLARSLAAERTERIRSQERADVGAHLHDSVLQTLALIQRSAHDPKQVAALARRQERELRGWLADGDSREPGDSLAAALEAAAAEVEAMAGGSVEVVAVGDCSLDQRGGAVMAAAREAMLNAAKFAGQKPVSVYAELSAERIQVFVRDRGAGFDPAAVPQARRGVRESIIGRMLRTGGRATVRSLPGGGTEVEIAIDRGTGCE
ncbi:MAG TPA: ATP-binding protein [Solirubrobacteraceae bacterium]|jgi:signal transduction histidine kinase|nr:ATP-binding protein [Solirubrobacteraceae bacterium]